MPRLRHSLLILVLLSIPLFFIRINNTHDWGDDYTQYLKEGQNIASGKPFYQTNNVHNELNTDFGPPQYPPGFPLILAPVIKVYGISLLPLMYLNTVLMVGLLFAIFFYFRKYASDLTAICISVVAIYSTNMIDMKPHILSDIPCALFTTIYLVLRNSERFPPRRTLLLILSALMAVLTRSQLMILLLAEALFLVLDTFVTVYKSKRFSFKAIYNSISLKIIAGVVLLNLLLANTIFATPRSTVGYYNQFFNYGDKSLWGLIGYNVNYLLDLFRTTFHLNMADKFWQAPVTIMEYTCIVFMVAGFTLSIRKKIRVDDIFFVLVCGLMLLLPVYQGYRFLFPLVAVTLYYAYVGARLFLPQLLPFSKKKIALFATAFYFIMAFDTIHSSFGVAHLDKTPYAPEDTTAFAWIRHNISDTDLIIFTKPRALTLFTNKRTMVLAPNLSFEKNMAKMKQVNAKYVLVRKDLDDGYYNGFVKTMRPVPDSVIIDSVYTLYSIK